MNERVSFQQQDVPVHLASQQKRGVVACPICQARYAPTHAHGHLLQAPPQMLEAAFMSMCHFCFRCRRPACPACWDETNSICGACVRDVNLPFRHDAPPLQGALPGSVQHSSERRAANSSLPLVCIQPGLFDAASPAILATPTTHATDPVQAVQPPGNTVAFTSGQPSRETYRDIHETSTSTRAEAHGKRFLRRLEVIVTLLALVVLMGVVAMIATASFSVQANTFLASLLHIDIRAEIAYLWQLIHHLW